MPNGGRFPGGLRTRGHDGVRSSRKHMSGFKGSYISTLDSKARVAVPARLRRSTDAGPADRFVITLGLNGCLFLFPPGFWDQVQRKIAAQSFTQKKTLYFTRKLMFYAEDVELDRQSRIRIPQRLLDLLQTEKEVLFIGAIERIELWKPERYEQYLTEFETEHDTSYEDVAEELLL